MRASPRPTVPDLDRVGLDHLCRAALPALLLAPADFIEEIGTRLAAAGVQDAVARHDNGPLCDQGHCGAWTMLTGCQIREARELLRLTPSKLAEKTRVVTTDTLKRVEAGEVGPRIANSHVEAIRKTLERLGVEFTAENGVRLRKGGHSASEGDR